jgi:hypothetical protein
VQCRNSLPYFDVQFHVSCNVTEMNTDNIFVVSAASLHHLLTQQNHRHAPIESSHFFKVGTSGAGKIQISV